MATQRLTIFLLRDITDLEDALGDDVAKAVDARELTQASGLTGRFYSKKSFSKKPGWATYLDPAVNGGVQDVQSSSASGLLLLQIDGNTYALTFGYGRSFPRPGEDRAPLRLEGGTQPDRRAPDPQS